jgi:hypothetical protein
VGLEVVDLVVRFWSCGLEVLSFVGKDWRYVGGLGSSSVWGGVKLVLLVG